MEDPKVDLIEALAAAQSFPFPHDVACFVASSAASATATELDRLVLRMINKASLSGQPVTISLAREVMDRLPDETTR